MQDLILAATNYYNGRPTGMTDEMYDSLLQEAKNENPEFDIFKVITIGGDRETVRHTVPFTQQEFKIQFRSRDEFDKLIEPIKNDWVCTPKFDGSSIRAYYLDGKLSDIVTRSNEIDGKRKFDQLRNKVPNVVDKEVLTIDFEALCSIEDFKEDTRSNANGLVNSCNMQERVDKYLHLIPFKVTPRTKMNYMDAMKLVFNDEDFMIVDINNIDYETRTVEFHGLHYPIDGFVFYKDTELSHKIYKHYFNQDLSTIVTNIQWVFTNILCWNPKIQFNPIYIDGRRVAQATSNGLKRLQSIKAGIGSEITIILANSTIPQVHKVIEPSENYNIPEVCPFCGHKMSIVNNKIRCENDFCYPIVNSVTAGLLWRLGLKSPEKLDTIEKFRIYWETNKTDVSNEDLISKLIESLIIENFKKHNLIIEQLLDKISELKDGKSIKEFVKYGLTEKQRSVFNTFIPIVDELIKILIK